MGARPIACMDSLRFGEIDAPRMRYLVDGVVRGIGDYGNCVGIPTVGGETGFHRCYNGNILVNAFALGIARHDRDLPGHAPAAPAIRSSTPAAAPAATASTAPPWRRRRSTPSSEKKRPTVQVGDPFTEKVLLEACLEAMRTDAIVAIQDMGAAGLTSSTFEMAGRGGTGIRLDLDRVPLREPGLTPYEIMLSESQERMVLVAKRGREEELAKVFRRWGLEVESIGEITGERPRRAAHWQGGTVADIPIAAAHRGGAGLPPPGRRAAPTWPSAGARPRCRRRRLDGAARRSRTAARPPPNWPARRGSGRSTTTPCAPTPCSVRAATPRCCCSRGRRPGSRMTSDVNPVYCWLDPRRGGTQAVAEAVRNLACAGAEPVGLTDCLNFGNPENPEIAWQFREAVRGMADACRALGVPVISGNVSFYNETEGQLDPPDADGRRWWGSSPRSTDLPRPGSRTRGTASSCSATTPASSAARPTCACSTASSRAGRPRSTSKPSRASPSCCAVYRLQRPRPHRSRPRPRAGSAWRSPNAASAPGWGRRWSWRRTSWAARRSSPRPRRGRWSPAPRPRSGGCCRSAVDSGVPAREIGAVGGGELSIRGGERFRLKVESLRRAWETALPRALGL